MLLEHEGSSSALQVLFHQYQPCAPHSTESEQYCGPSQHVYEGAGVPESEPLDDPPPLQPPPAVDVELVLLVVFDDAPEVSLLQTNSTSQALLQLMNFGTKLPSQSSFEMPLHMSPRQHCSPAWRHSKSGCFLTHVKIGEQLVRLHPDRLGSSPDGHAPMPLQSVPRQHSSPTCLHSKLRLPSWVQPLTKRTINNKKTASMAFMLYNCHYQ